jgi:excisionase family DNA binding protein
MVNMSPGIYEVKDIMRIMHISRNTAYKLLRQEGIPQMRVGGHYKIPAERFHQWLDSQFAHLQSEPDYGTMQM